VKPPNVLIGNDGRTVLTDFGIAVVEGSTHLTLTGQLVGSPEYLAPERALGRAPGPASDLWSLGVMLYAAVEGAVPFRYDSVLSTMRAIVEEQPRRPRHAGPLTPVIEGLLRKDPEERPAAGDVARMLAIAAEGGDPRKPEAAFRQSPAPHPAYSPTVRAPGPWPTARPTRTSPATPYGTYGPPSAPSPTAEAPSRRRRITGCLLVAALILALVVGGLVWARSGGDAAGTGSDGGSTGGAPAGDGTWGSDGSGRQRTVDHAETSHDPSGTRPDRTSVKIRSAHQVASEQVQFSIASEAEPKSGASKGYKSQSPNRLDGTTPTTSH
jgi:hypothetical protein